MKVEKFAGTPGEWDAFVRLQVEATHCHRFGWKSVIEEALGHEFIPLCVRDGSGNLVGVLPLVQMRSLLFGRYLVSMPFLNYGGPLGSREAIGALCDHAKVLARESSVKRLELRSREALPVELDVSLHKVSAILELPAGGTEALSKSFSSKLRSQVRRAEREAVSVRFGPAEVESFHRVFSQHMTRLGTPTYPLRFFESIAREFGPDAWIGCVYHEGTPIAAGFALRWGGEVEMTWASALAEYNKIAPNMLLYWSFLKRAADAGLDRFDFGRSTPGSGTHRFKQQWGTRDLPLWWYSYSPSGYAGSTSSDVGVGSWAPRVWKKLPISIARIVGPPIRRAIPL